MGKSFSPQGQGGHTKEKGDGESMVQATALCRTEGVEVPCQEFRELSVPAADGVWNQVQNVRMSQCHKERTCRLIVMRRVGRSFVPVIFLTNHCAPGDAFFFK